MKRVSAGVAAVLGGAALSILVGLYGADAGGRPGVVVGVSVPMLLVGPVLGAMFAATLGVFASEFAMDRLRAPLGALFLPSVGAIVATIIGMRSGAIDGPYTEFFSLPHVPMSAACVVYVLLTGGFFSSKSEPRPVLLRAGAGLSAALLGCGAGALSLWLALGGPEQENAAGWTIILGIFVFPLMVCGVFTVLLLLDQIVENLKLPPVSLAPLAAAPALIFLMGRTHAFAPTDEWAPFVTLTVIASSAAATTYLLVATPAMLRPRASIDPPASDARKAKPRHSGTMPALFTTVVLKQPPDTAELLDFLTSPRRRIGQHQFLYAAQILSLAGSVWFPLPLIAGAWLKLPHDVAMVLAWAGWFVLLWGAFCVTANRAHDLGLSAFWGAAPIALAATWLLAEGPPDAGWVSMTALNHAIIAGVFCYAATIAILLPIKGQSWSNEYGPAPD